MGQVLSVLEINHLQHRVSRIQRRKRKGGLQKIILWPGLVGLTSGHSQSLDLLVTWFHIACKERQDFEEF